MLTLRWMPEAETPPPNPSTSSFDGKVKRAFVLYVILPCLALFAAWLWVKNERAALKVRGHTACVASRHDDEWCTRKAEENHERCIELTFKPGTKTAGESFNPEGYVECLEIGPKKYWDLEAARALERKSQQPSGPYYH